MYREHSLSPRDRAALAEQSARLKKNDGLLQLRKEIMLPRITGKMAHLKTEICHIFARLGQACKQDCIGKSSANRTTYQPCQVQSHVVHIHLLLNTQLKVQT